MLTSAFTCSDQDVGVSQQRGHRRAFGALRDGKGGLRRLRATCAFAPVLGSVPAQPSSPGSVRPLRSCHLAPAHLCTHVCTHLGGDLRGLQYAQLQSWEENTYVILLLKTASLQSAFPSGFSFSPTPFIGRGPRDAVTVFGDIVQAGTGRGGSQPCSHGREQQNSLYMDCVRSVLSTHEAGEYANALRQAASCLLGSHN